MTTVCYIAQNVIWSNNVFLANCVEMSCFLFSQCPYTYRMVETLSLCPLIEANNVRKNIFLIWNGTSWNTENCWNFWPTCFGLWGISFWKRKNGSGTPCISCNRIFSPTNWKCFPKPAWIATFRKFSDAGIQDISTGISMNMIIQKNNNNLTEKCERMMMTKVTNI